MDPFTIAAIVATIAGAGLQHKAQADALKRQQDQARMSQQRALQARNEATQVAMKRVEDFDPGQRQQQQDTIAQELTQQLTQAAQPGITAQGVQVGSTLPAGSGTADFAIAQAKEKAKTTESLRALAALMGRIGASGELRRREAVNIGDTAGQIGRIQTGANNIGQIDQIGIQAAGAPDFLTSIVGAGLSSFGVGQLATAGIGALSGAGGAASAGTGLSPSAPTGLGLRPAAGGLGLRAPSFGI